MAKSIITTKKLRQTVDFGKIADLISSADAKSIISQTTETKIVQKSVIDLAELPVHQLKMLIDIQKNKIENLKLKYDEVLRKLKSEDNFWPRLKQALGLSLVFAGGSVMLTLVIFFAIASAPLVAPITTVFYLSTLAIVFLSVFILSTPLSWLISSKNSQELTNQEDNYAKTLANENTLLNVFTQAADKNKFSMLEKDSPDERNSSVKNVNNSNSHRLSKTPSAENSSGVNNSDSSSEILRYTN